jgi:hypothetical protein
MIRLPNIPPRDLGPNQRALFDKMRDGVRQHLTGFTTQRGRWRDDWAFQRDA